MPRLLNHAACLLAAATAVLVASVPGRGATPAEVNAAIQKAKDYLYAHQAKDGSWENTPNPDPKGGQADVNGKQWGGLTAIATYAELAAGESATTEPRLAKPILFLQNANIQGIYATGLRCQSWFLLNDPKKFKPFIERDKVTLLNAVYAQPAKAQSDEFGFYPYWFEKGQQQPANWYDRSVSQYGVLGVWALEQAGAEIPVSYWRLVDSAWRKAQHSDGGWSYRKADGPDKGASSVTMTAAGIATLFITQDYTLGSGADCKGNITNPNIDAGLAWMDKHIMQALGGNYYGMYGIERIGVASGHKYFGPVDWFHVGADFLVKNQAADGSWGGDIPNTCFGLLFLARGRAPVIMNKLQYEVTENNGKAVEGPWNERPRDVANFAHWMGTHSVEGFFNWQVVNLRVPIEELHDSPILYISGNKELDFNNIELEKLRTFAEQGGVILGNSDCNNAIFSKSFEKLGNKLFPNYAFRDLPPGHPIFLDEQYPARLWKSRLKVRGLSNGIRELMLLAPEADMARGWHTRSEKTKQELYELGADIFLYAVDKKNLMHKGETYIVKDDPGIQTTRSATLVRLEAGDNWDPEPAGWRRLASILHNTDKVALTIKKGKIDAQTLKGAQLANLTGTAAVQLTEDQRKALKDFVDGGGTLIVDAAGASTEFANSAGEELMAIFGAPAVKEMEKPLPLANPIYNMTGAKVESIHYRKFAGKSLVGDLRSPRIAVITVKGRPAVFFSREDLAAGLTGEPIDGIPGYEPATATALMRSIVLFGAFGLPKPPATQPATHPATQPTTLPTTQPAPTIAPAVPAPAAPAQPPATATPQSASPTPAPTTPPPAPAAGPK
jgi:Domain of unknown function (DUF4159)/Prenyltransferase and squalene oxidase repeat